METQAPCTNGQAPVKHRLRIGDVLEIGGREVVVYAKTTHSYYVVEARIADVKNPRQYNTAITAWGKHEVKGRNFGAAVQALRHVADDCLKDARRAKLERNKALHMGRYERWKRRFGVVYAMSIWAAGPIGFDQARVTGILGRDGLARMLRVGGSLGVGGALPANTSKGVASSATTASGATEATAPLAGGGLGACPPGAARTGFVTLDPAFEKGALL